MRSNFHTHTTWCDGKDDPEAVVRTAIDKGFEAIGFSSHVSFPEVTPWVLGPDRAPEYVREIRALAAKYADRIKVFLGAEADYIPGVTAPEKARYAHLGLDYLIGSIHYVVAADGGRVPVDHEPQLLADGIRDHFGGDVRKYICAYFRQQRDMVTKFDFDVVGHLDLVRKFNLKHSYFDENVDWYRAELEKTADAVAVSGKLTEVNTGAISRGWQTEAYPSPFFRELLRVRGVRFILSADAHAADAIDCAFDRYGDAENYLERPWQT